MPLVAQRHLAAAVLLHVHLFHAYRVAHLQPGCLVQRDAADNRVTVERQLCRLFFAANVDLYLRIAPRRCGRKRGRRFAFCIRFFDRVAQRAKLLRD